MKTESAAWLCQTEELLGYRVVRPGDEAWLPLSDWHPFTIASTDGARVRLVALQAQQEGQGALRRLIAAISAAGMQPVIVEPFTALEQTLRRWGWKERRAGRGDLAHTIWHPRETLEKPCLSGSIR